MGRAVHHVQIRDHVDQEPFTLADKLYNCNVGCFGRATFETNNLHGFLHLTLHHCLLPSLHKQQFPEEDKTEIFFDSCATLRHNWDCSLEKPPQKPQIIRY